MIDAGAKFGPAQAQMLRGLLYAIIALCQTALSAIDAQDGTESPDTPPIDTNAPKVFGDRSN